MKTNSVPKIRFKGFTDDWEQRKAGEIFKSVSDKGYTDLPVLSASQELGMILRDEIGIDIKYDESSIKNYKRVKPGQFVIHLRSFQGGFAWSDIEGITSPAYTILDYQEPEEHCSKFWKIVLTSPMFITRLETVTYGIRDGRSISFTDFSTLNLNVPSIAEQQKIGEYFSKLDNLITLHQRKCEQTKELKKFMLQKMFPKKGEKNPEIRFPGFTDDWEQRKFPEFVEFYNGLTYSPDDVRASGTLVLRSSNVKNGEIVDADNVYVEPDKATSENVKEGDIIVVVRNGSRALIGKHAEIKESMSNTVIGAFMSGIRSEHSSFVNALLDTNQFEKEIEKNMGATINQITGYMFSKMEFTIPSPTEQDKIGNYFKYLDHLITLHQRKCEQLKELKKFMLQNMFPKKG